MNRGKFSPFLDFCPNVVTLAQEKLLPPYFGHAESKKKQGLEHGVMVARLCRGPNVGHLALFCMLQTQKNSTFTYFHYGSRHERFLCIWVL